MIDFQVSGLPFKPIGFSVTYAANTIPTMLVNLDPTTGTLCDIDQLKRQPMNAKFRSDFGCLSFDGLFDDIQFSQTRSGFSYSAVLKSPYQRLTEVSCKIPGLSPFSTIDPFENTSFVRMTQPNKFLFEIGTKSIPIDDTTPLFTLILDILKAGLEAQKDPYAAFVNTLGNYKSLWNDVVNNPAYIQNIDIVISLLDAIDTTAVDGFVLNSGSILAGVLSDLFQNTSNTTVWGFLINTLSQFSCQLLIGNGKAWIVPENGFIQVVNTAPGVGEISKIPNLIYPAQVDSLSYSGNGFIDLRACYVVGRNPIAEVNLVSTMELGVFVDSEAPSYGGVLVVSPPTWFYSAKSYALSGSQQEKSTNTNDRATMMAYDNGQYGGEWKERYVATKEVVHNTTSPLTAATAFMTGYAQMQYYQAKYRDRTGSVSVNFDSNICPGTSGAAYSRYPGHFINFYVTAVTHNVSITPSGGSANTSVQFSHGRMGGSLGIDKDLLYNYTTGKMENVQDGFISSIT